jgi:hypothetical protein
MSELDTTEGLTIHQLLDGKSARDVTISGDVIDTFDIENECDHIDFFGNPFTATFYYTVGYKFCPKCSEKL